MNTSSPDVRTPASAFCFQPLDGAVEGPAFSAGFQVLSTLIVGGCASWLLHLHQQGLLTRTLGHTQIGWWLGGMGMMVWTWIAILRSRTRIDAQGLQQRWVWNKRVDFQDLTYAKLIRVPGFDWLIAPRLFTRTVMGKPAVFYGATPALIAEFERLAGALRECHQTETVEHGRMPG